MALIRRSRLLAEVRRGLRESPVTSLLGPRQCGKTTLARLATRGARATFFDLESPRDLQRLADPEAALEPLRGLVVIDEIQRRPALHELLRVLADRRPLPARFLILGSADPATIRRSSESLAGRVRFVSMGGLTLDETGPLGVDRLWWRGGFPLAYRAASDGAARRWTEDFVRTFLERDIPQLEVRIPAEQLRRFWTMLAHAHGQSWNASQIGGSMGLAHTTVRRYLDLLSGAFMVRQLQPWFVNPRKRVVKSPKVYLRDTGILHALLDLPDHGALRDHPKLGASWEGFALEQVLARTGSRQAWFWGTHGGAELDLYLPRGGRGWGFEFKAHTSPAPTKSMRIAMEDLKLRRLWVVHPGTAAYPLGGGIEALPLAQLDRALDVMGRR